MKQVESYRSFEGASRALDNGGRLRNVLTTAGDRVITGAELGAAGARGGWTGALLFFDLATSRLSDQERDELACRLEPKLRRHWTESRPRHLRAGELGHLGEEKSPIVVEGTARRVGTAGPPVGCVPVTVVIANVPMVVQTPALEVHGVYEIEDSGGTRVGLTSRRAKLPEGEPLAFGGLVRRGTATKDAKSPERTFIDLRYWQRAWRA